MNADVAITNALHALRDEQAKHQHTLLELIEVQRQRRVLKLWHDAIITACVEARLVPDEQDPFATVAILLAYHRQQSAESKTGTTKHRVIVRSDDGVVTETYELTTDESNPATADILLREEALSRFRRSHGVCMAEEAVVLITPVSVQKGG